mgnify:CR=1 FL=1
MYINLLHTAHMQISKTCNYHVNEHVAFISNYIQLESKDTFICNTDPVKSFDVPKRANAVINYYRINDIRYINKYFESVNAYLSTNNLFCGCFESISSRKERKKVFKIPVLGQFIHFLEFLILRIWPKLKWANKLYFFITKGRNRLLTETEVLGRLVSCGFEIIDYKNINGLTYFIVKKVQQPLFDKHPSYGPLCKMQRVGKAGKIIGVYKFRTMHPYAEYLQDFILRKNGYSEIGKPACDFRLTSYGKFMRKYWLDELPQLINVLKGEMNLVGVRPLSKRFLAEYPEDLKLMRFKYKPGCVPPYVALLKQDVSQYLESERVYLNEKEKNPLKTDIKFFFKAAGNIITNKIKSA